MLRLLQATIQCRWPSGIPVGKNTVLLLPRVQRKDLQSQEAAIDLNPTATVSLCGFFLWLAVKAIEEQRVQVPPQHATASELVFATLDAANGLTSSTCTLVWRAALF